MKSILKSIVLLFLTAVLIVTILLILNKKDKEIVTVKKKLALIQYNDSPLSDLSQEGILIGLSQIGLKRGVDYDIKISNAQGDISTLNLLIETTINDKPDLVFVTSSPTLQVAVKKIKKIPVIFTVVADPFILGIGKGFNEHLPNITGISTLGDYEGMIHRIQIIMPKAKTIGTLYSPGETNSVKNRDELKKYAELAGLKLITIPVNSSTEVTDAAIALASNRPDAICQIIDNLTSGAFSEIAKVSKDQKIPLFGFVSDQAEKGAIVVVSRNYQQAGIDAVMLAKKVFDGVKPADIPIEFVSKTDVYINPGAAELYGIIIPENLLNAPDVIKIYKHATE